MTVKALACLVNSVPPTTDQIVANVGFLTAHRVHPDDIATRLHSTRDTLAQRLRRAGAADLATYMAPTTPAGRN